MVPAALTFSLYDTASGRRRTSIPSFGWLVKDDFETGEMELCRSGNRTGGVQALEQLRIIALREDARRQDCPNAAGSSGLFHGRRRSEAAHDFGVAAEIDPVHVRMRGP